MSRNVCANAIGIRAGHACEFIDSPRKSTADGVGPGSVLGMMMDYYDWL